MIKNFVTYKCYVAIIFENLNKKIKPKSWLCFILLWLNCILLDAPLNALLKTLNALLKTWMRYWNSINIYIDRYTFRIFPMPYYFHIHPTPLRCPVLFFNIETECLILLWQINCLLASNILPRSWITLRMRCWRLGFLLDGVAMKWAIMLNYP